MTASYRTDSIPPLDPWMSGETINYYYLGYLIYGTLSRIAGITTWIGYNLALATTASMALVAAGGAAFNIVRRGRPQRTRLDRCAAGRVLRRGCGQHARRD